MNYDWLFGDSSQTSKDKQSFEVCEPLWSTKDGTKIPISKMTTTHICNCIKLLERKNMYKCKSYQDLKNELEQRKAGKLEVSFSL